MKTTLQIATAQLNPVVGDIAGNAQRIVDAMADAKARGAQLLLTPELSLCGYPPEDLLLRADFFQACRDALERIAARTDDMAVVVGFPDFDDVGRYNAAAVMQGGRIIARCRKRRLPNYAVFDEKRYFDAASEACVFELAGVRCGLMICADMWVAGPAEGLRAAGAELVLVINASPCHVGKQAERHRVARERIAETGLPLLCVNMVGGQDELVFDGASFAMAADGALAWQAPSFEARVDVVGFSRDGWQADSCAPMLTEEEEAYGALVLGVRD